MAGPALLQKVAAGRSVEVVVPVYNEEPILRSQLESALKDLPGGFGILVVENGSDDGTAEILREMADRWPRNLRVLSLPEPNYGRAMMEGILGSGAEVLITDDLDVLDRDFWARGLEDLSPKGPDLIQGSKVLAGKSDRRPLSRRIATLVLTFFLRTLLGYRGTDTHGPKVFWRGKLAPVVESCRMELDIFPTELVVRAQRRGLEILEIPIRLRELRPTPLPLYRRVPRALRDLFRLAILLHRDRRSNR